MKYTISVFDDPKRIPELVKLFSTGLGETSAEHWRWRLFTPNGLEDQPFAVVAQEEESNRLLGVSTVIPVYYGKDKIKAILFGDWVVHPSARGQGIIGKIFDYICAYAKENGYEKDEILYVGDDFGDGGGDSHVRLGGMDYVFIDDYRTLPEKLAHL